MYGAILGDIIGRPYEFDRGSKTKVFPLFSTDSAFTADTVMTIAVAEAFMDAPNDERAIRRHLTASIHKFGRFFPNAGYGVRFGMWLQQDETGPYNPL